MEEHQNVTEEQTASMSDDVRLTTAADKWLHPLEPYAPKKALAEMTRRWMALNKTGKKEDLTSAEAALLIQRAMSTQLNPFNDEIWGWVTIRGDHRILTIMPGRKGILRQANEKAEEKGMEWYADYRLILDPEERENYLIPEGATAWEAIVRDDITRSKWTEDYKAFSDAGLSDQKIIDRIGECPSWVGLGIMTQEERKQLDKRGTNKFTHKGRIQKRALMAGVQLKFNLQFGAPSSSGLHTFEDYIKLPTPSADDDTVDAEFEEKPQEKNQWTNDELKPRKNPKWWPPELPEKMVEAKLASDKFNAAHILSLSPFGKGVKINQAKAWMKEYQQVKKEIADGGLDQKDFKEASRVAEETTWRYLKNMK